jgi:hypothetical protein
MGLRPTYMDETHLEWMSFDGVGGNSPRTRTLADFPKRTGLACRVIPTGQIEGLNQSRLPPGKKTAHNFRK